MDQKLFVKSIQDAVAKVHAQGHGCMQDNECSYENENGEHCAIGHLMTKKELYKNRYSTLGVASLITRGKWRPNVYTDEQRSALIAFQACHDVPARRAFGLLFPVNFCDDFLAQVKTRLGAEYIPAELH